MHRMTLLFSAGCLVVVLGCGDAKPPTFDAAIYRGVVDTSLPATAQKQQQAVQRWLNAMQEGVGETAGLRLLAPGIDYREPFDAFYGSHKRLVKWDFSGPPANSVVTVVLHFDDQDAGPIDLSRSVREERNYSVALSGGQATISRK